MTVRHLVHALREIKPQIGDVLRFRRGKDRHEKHQALHIAVEKVPALKLVPEDVA